MKSYNNGKEDNGTEKKTMERSCAAAAAVSNKKLTYANVVAGKKPLPILDGPDSEEEFTSKPHEWVKVERKRPKEAKKGHLKLYLKKRSFKTQLSTPRMTTKKNESYKNATRRTNTLTTITIKNNNNPWK
ncbi:uncharacterized protein LOC135499173 [Lineus longissimus]|uniref:uncharacterized protein LOC135499173 n=1 Tax=Lineus longissimus TaxID=88925 RepID=UPI00315DADA0